MVMEITLEAPAYHLLFVKSYQIQAVEHTDIEHTLLNSCTVCYSSYSFLYFCFPFLLVVLESEPGASCLPGRDSTTELYTSPSFCCLFTVLSLYIAKIFLFVVMVLSVLPFTFCQLLESLTRLPDFSPSRSSRSFLLSFKVGYRPFFVFLSLFSRQGFSV